VFCKFLEVTTSLQLRKGTYFVHQPLQEEATSNFPHCRQVLFKKWGCLPS